MDRELRELHRGGREERKRLTPDPEPNPPERVSNDDLPEAPDTEMECPKCDWEGDDSMVRYVGFENDSRYNWKQVHRQNITVEALACPVCDSFEVENKNGW